MPAASKVPEHCRIAVVGLGKIARDQHLPAIAAAPGFDLAAVVDPRLPVGEVVAPAFASLDELLASGLPFDALALCQPPQMRHAAALAGLRAGKHVLLEKPPAATVSGLQGLVDEARARGLALHAAWHSRHAAAVAEATRLLAARTPRRMQITWHEDVRQWHPGQQWIWEAGGMGVFDPGINALSIATAILPGGWALLGGELLFPAHRASPIAAELQLLAAGTVPVQAHFDWRVAGRQRWDILVETASGPVELLEGGARLGVDGTDRPVPPAQEYAGVYAAFADAVARRACEVDALPLQLVADACMACGRRTVEPFEG